MGRVEGKVALVAGAGGGIGGAGALGAAGRVEGQGLGNDAFQRVGNSRVQRSDVLGPAVFHKRNNLGDAFPAERLHPRQHLKQDHPRGEEVSASVLEGAQSLVWQQAENRMHAMRGLLLFLAEAAS